MTGVAVKDDYALNGLAHDLLDAVIEDVRDPQFRIMMAVGMGSTAVLARAGMRFLPTLLVSVALAVAAGDAYRVLGGIGTRLDGADATGQV